MTTTAAPRRLRLPGELRPEQVTVVIDSREQLPLDLSPLQSVTGLPVVMCADHEREGRYVSRLLHTAARRRWREARALVGNVTEHAG